ncbi:MAG: hypothetical protein GXP08_18170 [Gammaproteobacteria bacterium]|nr:hypothetical protein [Gammaproteobacteria bacterium]
MENAIEINKQNKLLDASPVAFDSILKGFVNKLILNSVGRLVAMHTMDYSIILGADTMCDNSLVGTKLIKKFYQDNYVEVYGKYIKDETIRATQITFGNSKNLEQKIYNRDVEFEGQITQVSESQIIVSNISVCDEGPQSIRGCISVELVPGDCIGVKALMDEAGKIIATSIRLLG